MASVSLPDLETLETSAKKPSTRPAAHRKLRVLRLFSRLNIGGPAIHVILTTAGLDPERYEPLLVVGREGDREGNFLGMAEAKGIPMKVIPTFGRRIDPFRDLITLARLVRLMKRERPDIVHTHTAKAGALGRLAARLAGVPVVVHTFHGSVFDGYFGPRVAGLFQWIERKLALRTDTIIAVSERVAADLVERRIAPRDKIEVVPLGLELDRFRNVELSRGELRRELGLPLQAQLVGSVGRLVPIKDLPTLLGAMVELSATQPEAILLVVGDGPERPALEQLAGRLGLSSRVRFLGFRDDLERIYADLDVAVNCSLNEGTPVSLIEAMASGVPVIATAVGGTPDLLDEGRLGKLVPAADPKALARGLAEILSGNGRLTKTATRARRSVTQRFSLERLLGDLDGLYLRLLKSQNQREIRGRKPSEPRSI
jgi:glycosyltransferase involved in cell wall biosynthesis